MDAAAVGTWSVECQLVEEIEFLLLATLFNNQLWDVLYRPFHY
jgi:hypothetical protein